MFRRPFQQLTIEEKFAGSVMAVTALALAGSLAAFVVQETYHQRQAAVRQSEIIGAMVASGSLAALTFEDADLAKKSLMLLDHQRQVAYAALYLKDGRPLAALGEPEDAQNPKPFAEGVSLHVGWLQRDQIIRLQGEEVGRLRLVLRMDGLWRTLAWAFGTALIIAAGSFGLALALSRPLRHNLIRPLQTLARTARRVSQRGDYSLRVPGEGPDELGQLVADFNGMLAQIEASDRELRLHHDHLETLIQERTQELSRAMVKAESANKAKGEFLATMSHEIRTPLNGILGLSTLLMDSSVPPREHQLVAKIGIATQALLTVIGNVLDFSRLEAGKVTLESKAFDLEQLVLPLEQVVALQAKAKGLELAVDVAPEVPQKAVGDPSRLSQVLLNLLGNAVKFTDQGSVLLRVRLSPDRPENLVFEVLDTGPGIPPDLLPSLFTPFTQADGSFTRRHGGSGLGLSISQGLATLMGGTLEAIPLAEGGTCFRLTLPCKAFETARPAPSLQAKRVLILGTLPLTIAILETQLRALGADVQVPPAPASMQLGDLEEAGPWDLVLVALDPDNEHAKALHLDVRTGTFPAGQPRKILCIPCHATTPDPGFLGTSFDAVLSAPLSRTVFWNTLESLLSPSSAQPPPPADVLSESLRNADLAPTQEARRILVVDDNDMNREVFAEILTRMGHQVVTAEDGLQALAILQKEAFHLVLMDCQMPHMDGFESTRRIRKLELPHCKVPIVAMTGNVRLEDREHCLESGMDDVLTKPVHAKDLKAVLNKWLSPVDHPEMV